MISRRLLEIIRYYHCTTSNDIGLPIKSELNKGTVVDCKQPLTNGNPYNYIKGVPYTVPSLEDSSFKAPISLKGFYDDEMAHAKENDLTFLNGEVTDLKGSLFLNVFTPKHENTTSLPVMLFTSGDRYDFNSESSDLYTPNYLIQEDVVVVTLNYSNGSYDFLALPRTNVPEVAARNDQHLAVKWIKENISQFNGDPSNITLLGDGFSCFRSSRGGYMERPMVPRLRNFKIR